MKILNIFFNFIYNYFFLLFKIIRIKIHLIFGKLFEIIGPFFRSKKLINQILKSISKLDKIKKILKICGIIMEEFLLNICL